jgi:NADH dehydrogenase
MAEALGGTLVIGGGFAGGYVARLLGKRGATIASPENFMLYTPMLPEAASGTLEPRHVVVPLREMCPHAELLLGRATELDVAGRSAQVETEEGIVTVGYENVVVALGAISRTLPIPGLADHALGFKTSPTRSTSATTSSAASKQRWRRRARDNGAAS